MSLCPAALRMLSRENAQQPAAMCLTEAQPLLPDQDQLFSGCKPTVVAAGLDVQQRVPGCVGFSTPRYLSPGLCLRVGFFCNPAVESEVQQSVGTLRPWLSVVTSCFKMPCLLLSSL